MGGHRITGNTSGNIVEVDENGQLLVASNTDVTKAGFTRIASESDPGVVTGTAKCLSPETSEDFRLRVGMDTILFEDAFNYANQHTANTLYTASSMSMAHTGGRLITNSGSTVAANTSTRLRSWQEFALFGQQTPLYVAFNLSISALLTTNTTFDIGLFRDGGSNPFAPTDGVFLRATSAGAALILNYGGVETSSGVLPNPEDATESFTPAVDTNYSCLLAIGERTTQLWIDDILMAEVDTPTAQARPCQSKTLPWAVRHAIGGTPAGAALQFRVWDFSVTLGDLQTGKPWSHQMAIQGGGLQVQQGATTGGQLSTWALGAAPATVTLTASTAPATNTLGGQFLLPVAITVAESDYPLFAWLNPAGTVAIPGKTFVCTGVRVCESYVSVAALTGGPVALHYAIGWGSTASSLATTESTTFSSATTKIARKEALGIQTFAATAAHCTVSPGFQVDFSSAPKVVYPGQYLHIILRVTGVNLTAGTGQIRGAITPLGYFE